MWICMQSVAYRFGCRQQRQGLTDRYPSVPPLPRRCSLPVGAPPALLRIEGRLARVVAGGDEDGAAAAAVHAAGAAPLLDNKEARRRARAAQTDRCGLVVDEGTQHHRSAAVRPLTSCSDGALASRQSAVRSLASAEARMDTRKHALGVFLWDTLARD